MTKGEGFGSLLWQISPQNALFPLKQNRGNTCLIFLFWCIVLGMKTSVKWGSLSSAARFKNICGPITLDISALPPLVIFCFVLSNFPGYGPVSFSLIQGWSLRVAFLGSKTSSKPSHVHVENQPHPGEVLVLLKSCYFTYLQHYSLRKENNR